LSQPPIFRPLNFTVMFICAEVSLTAPVYESVPSKVISPAPVIGISPVHCTVHVAFEPLFVKFEFVQLLSAPAGGRVHSLAVQTFEVCAGIFIGIPSITVCEVVSHKTPG